MGRSSIVAILSLTTALMGARYAVAGQAPAAASDPDIPISHQDRVYSAEQYSNTVSVTDPVDNKLPCRMREPSFRICPPQTLAPCRRRSFATPLGLKVAPNSTQPFKNLRRSATAVMKGWV
jgi:hypothetical protein